MTETDPEKIELARKLREANTELLGKDYEIGKFRAAAWMALSIPIGLAICVYFANAAGRDGREADKEVTLTGDCANVRTEIGPDRSGAKVILPPGCHYKDNF